MTASIREMCSRFTQLSVSSRATSRTRRSLPPRGLAVLVVSAYLLQCATGFVKPTAGADAMKPAAGYGQLVMDSTLAIAGAGKYPARIMSWAFKNLENFTLIACDRCNPNGLKEGKELSAYLENHPKCKPCKICGGDGLFRVSDIPTNMLRMGSDMFAKYCPACNKDGEKDSTDSEVRECQYCEGDGLLHMTDRLSCPNCLCDDSGLCRKDCKLWHLTTNPSTCGKCPTKPCAECTAKIEPDEGTNPNPWYSSPEKEGKDRRLMERPVRLEGPSKTVDQTARSDCRRMLRRTTADIFCIGDSAETILSRRRRTIGDSREPPVLRELILKTKEANATN